MYSGVHPRDSCRLKSFLPVRDRGFNARKYQVPSAGLKQIDIQLNVNDIKSPECPLPEQWFVLHGLQPLFVIPETPDHFFSDVNVFLNNQIAGLESTDVL